MIQDSNNWELAEKYLAGTLSPEAYEALQHRLDHDAAFAATFQESLNLIQSLEDSGKHKRFRTMLVDIRKENNLSKSVRTIPLSTHYWRTAAVAAGIAIVTTLSTFWMISHNEKQRVSQYSMLRKELENIKRSQNVIINNINETKTAPPAAPASYSGTGMALANNGYFITNYHVVEGADSVYMQNAAGDYYKANLIAFDKIADLAILKVEDKKFRFSKNDLPYNFASGKNGIGARVFTLGYPDNEIVYNEGYISSKNGYEGDSLQYLLNMPSKPGHSGAPVVDRIGNVIGIVSANNNENNLNTYAVSSKVIYSLIKDLPVNIKLPKGNSLKGLTREQQVEKLEDFTCSVKVYKK
ncbi:MAG TPA: serine protease [Flavipsychrobacter sp.]|nr:serine protease [Flavipsychrobacter sp.]